MSLTTLFASTILNPNNTGVLVSGNFGSASYQSGGTSYALGSLPGWSFSNSTGGYSLDGTTSFAANTPRITSAGLLIEGAGTNYALGSSNIAGGPLASTTSVTLTANAVTAPDGTLTATQVLDQAAGTSPQVQGNTPTPATVLGDIYTVSMFVNPGGERYVALSMTNNSGSVTRHTALFDLVTATCIGTDVYSGGTLPYNTFVTPSASGWFRIGFTITVDALLAGSTLGPRFWLDQPGAALSGQAPPPYTVVGTPSIYVWGWQVEKAASASSYMPSTTSVSGTRAADVASLTYSGTATSIRVGYASGTATPATGSPLNLGASSGGAWVGQNIETFSIFGTASSGSGAGSVTAAATLSGAGVGNAPMAGSVTAAATLSGAGVSNYATTGSITAAATLSGAGVGNAPMAGSVTAAATLSGAGVSNYATTGSVTAAERRRQGEGPENSHHGCTGRRLETPSIGSRIRLEPVFCASHSMMTKTSRLRQWPGESPTQSRQCGRPHIMARTAAATFSGVGQTRGSRERLMGVGVSTAPRRATGASSQSKAFSPIMAAISAVTP